MSSPRQLLSPPNLIDSFDQSKREIKVEFNCVQIGVIESFDPTDQTASIQIVLKKIISVDTEGVRTVAEHPILMKCPVMSLYGGPGYIMLAPQPGDNCIILFNDREIDNWFFNGGSQIPDSFRTHDFSDAIGIVGIRNMQTALADYITDGLKLGYGGSSITIQDMVISLLSSLFTVTGDVTITGTLTADVVNAGNGVTGTFSSVTVENGIVVSGTP